MPKLNIKLKRRVEKILAKFPNCRDDDRALIGNVWQEEYLEMLGSDAYMNGTVNRREVIADFVRKKLTAPESIRRTRQKIQELQPLLRGRNYTKRQKHQGEIKREIRAFHGH